MYGLNKLYLLMEAVQLRAGGAGIAAVPMLNPVIHLQNKQKQRNNKLIADIFFKLDRKYRNWKILFDINNIWSYEAMCLSWRIAFGTFAIRQRRGKQCRISSPLKEI